MSDDEVIKQFLSRLPKDATRHISAFRTTLTILIRTIQPDPLGQEIRELIPHLAHVLSELTPQLLAGGVKRNFSVLGVSRIKALQQIAQGLFSSYLLAYIAHGKKLPTHGKLRWATFTHYGIRQAGELLMQKADTDSLDTDSLSKLADQCYNNLERDYKAGKIKWPSVVKPISLEGLRRSRSGPKPKAELGDK
jgi:hypothetical protein